MTPHPQRPGGGAWYGNVEGVDQTCFLLMSEEAIADLAEEFGKKELAEQVSADCRLADQGGAREDVGPEDAVLLHPRSRHATRRFPVRTIQGFLTLTCGAATPRAGRGPGQAVAGPEAVVGGLSRADRGDGRSEVRRRCDVARRHVAGHHVPGGLRPESLRLPRRGPAVGGSHATADCRARHERVVQCRRPAGRSAIRAWR